MECLNVSDGRNVRDMPTDLVCSIKCGFSVCSHLRTLNYAIYALACLERFCQISLEFLNL